MNLRDQRGLSRNVMLFGLVVIILAGSWLYMSISKKKETREAITEAAADNFEQYELGALTVSMPGGGEFKTEEIDIPETDADKVLSATNYIYVIQGFTCFITRAKYAEAIQPELGQLAASIIDQMQKQPTLDFEADHEPTTVSGFDAELITLSFSSKGTPTEGSTLIIRGEGNEYWMVNVQTYAEDDAGLDVSRRVIDSVELAGTPGE